MSAEKKVQGRYSDLTKEEKLKIRIEICDLLDKHCKSCKEKERFRRQSAGHLSQEENEFCNINCEIGKRYILLSEKLMPGGRKVSETVKPEPVVTLNNSIERTKENYIRLKNEGLRDKEIAERFGMLSTNLPTWKKKVGLFESDVTDSTHTDHNIVKVEEPKKEQVKEDRYVENTPGRFEKLAIDIGRLVDEKNAAYGDSFLKCGEFLKLLYPIGIKPEQYTDALSLVRIFDKQMRIANKKDAFGENPYRDIAGYGLLGAMKDNL